MILRRGEAREARRKFHGAELNEGGKSSDGKSPSAAGANKISRRLFSPLSFPADSIRSSPFSKDRLLLPLPEEKETRRREDGSLKSPVRFIYREKERRLSGDRFIEQRPVSGSASD